ncbi:hypothetical protein [Thermoactinomyces sp. DSM 45892]|uniref:hypothetical protein n=1 Tax=Thermoactinomyces sp. DSM 45892 TaxID=1882753 RepID=UPI00089C9E72|nr:hypothetical protein [Thermoactinomyces sp. DSM 45892]SDX93778.1 DNA primase [Thermoactinomyces sp. DSM 45892]
MSDLVLNDFQMIKQLLLDCPEKMEILLDSIGCHHLKYEQRGSLLTCGLPESDNKRSVQVRLTESLPCVIRSRADFSGDIFALVSYIHHRKTGAEIPSDVFNSKRYISQICQLQLDKMVHSIDWLVKVRKERKTANEHMTNPILPESILNQYYFQDSPLPFQGWIEEGISYETQLSYEIGFDLETKRITIPIRNQSGQLVGVKGRIMKDEEDDRKYLYPYKCKNSLELFNYHRALEHILESGRVYVFEAEKSPMKACSHGIYNTVGIGGSELSLEQARLLQSLGKDIQIILCYDQGKSAKDIKNQAMKLQDHQVFGMFDTQNLLHQKNSPIDQGIDIWNRLVQNDIYPIHV